MFAPVTVRPTSVATIALSEIYDELPSAVAPASVRAAGGAPAPPMMIPGTLGSRSRYALSPGPG